MFLDARRQKLVERLFEEALEQPADLRTAWLTRACAGDDLVNRETTALLAAHDHAGLFLEVPAFAMRGTGIGREPQPGERLGHYEILERLGEGGMGAVYRAIDHRLGRNVAIKFLSASLANNPEWLLRFDEEARLAGSLNHPNVLAVHDIGTGSSRPYLVSEVLEGETLRERLARRAVGVRAAVEIALGMARGLAAAHQQSIAHRDLKPENVFLTRDGQVKILDFGIAHRLPPADQSTADGARLLSRGARAGTIEYLSPEQARGEPADSRADLFAFGVVLYEMLAGVRPRSRGRARTRPATRSFPTNRRRSGPRSVCPWNSNASSGVAWPRSQLAVFSRLRIWPWRSRLSPQVAPCDPGAFAADGGARHGAASPGACRLRSPPWPRWPCSRRRAAR